MFDKFDLSVNFVDSINTIMKELKTQDQV